MPDPEDTQRFDRLLEAMSKSRRWIGQKEEPEAETTSESLKRPAAGKLRGA